MKQDPSEHLTLKEVTNLLEVYENTSRSWGKNCTLNTIRIGGRKRWWKKENVLKFLEAGEQQGIK